MLKNILKPLPFKDKKGIVITELIEHQSYKFFPLIGYALLIFIFVDYIFMLIPPQFFNPNWELRIMGKIIETVYVTLLGFLLVFFRPQKQFIKQTELRILSWLSRLALLLGIICFIFAPLLISNSLRINNTNQGEMNLHLENQRQQVQQFTLQLDNLSEGQIQSLWAKNHQNSAPNKNISLERQKEQLISKINSVEQTRKQQFQQKLKSTKRSLFKMTLKWIIGTIVAGACFISIWKYTEWARVIQAVKQPGK